MTTEKKTLKILCTFEADEQENVESLLNGRRRHMGEFLFILKRKPEAIADKYNCVIMRFVRGN